MNHLIEITERDISVNIQNTQINLDDEIFPHPIQIQLDDQAQNQQLNVQNIPSLEPLINRLLEKYLLQKKHSIFQLPQSGHQTMNAQFYDPNNTEVGWWVSEKLDGIRAIWTGQQLLTRRGKSLNPPSQFLENFPSHIALDGELFLKRKSFSETQSIVMNVSSPSIHEWEKLTYQVFDIPDSSQLTFEETQLLLKKYLPTKGPIRLLEQTHLKSKEQVAKFHISILKQQGEGTMLRKPLSKYQFARTNVLLKWKAYLDPKTQKLVNTMDHEARIVGYNYDYQKKLTNNNQIRYKLRSLQLTWVNLDGLPIHESEHSPNSYIEFNLSGGISQVEKHGDYEKIYPKGKIVKVLFQELSENLKPRFPRLEN